MNNIKRRGTRKEYYLVDKLRKEGYNIVQRTAGSFSPIDIIAIDIKRKEIRLIQSKRDLSNTMDFVNEKLKKKLEEDNKDLNGMFDVRFKVL